MGFFDFLSNWLQVKKKEANVLCIGLDNSGKSTILNKLKEENFQTMHVVPTIGFSVEQFSFGNFQLTAFDMSGQSHYRSLWEHYYGECCAVIFVVDSCDKIRMAVAREELHQMLNHPKMKEKPHLPVLFFANKTDLRNSASAIKVAQMLELDKGEWVKGGSLSTVDSDGESGRPWYICSSNALTGDGLSEGIQWLTDQLTKQ